MTLLVADGDCSGGMFTVAGVDDVCLVTNGGTVIGVHKLGPTQNVTSARWTQLESRKRVTCTASCVSTLS